MHTITTRFSGTFIRIAIAALASVVFFVSAPPAFAYAPGEVIVTEFVSDGGSDWVELLNTTNSSISLVGSYLVVIAGAPATTTLSGTLPPHGILTFTPTLDDAGAIINLQLGDAVMQSVSYGTAPTPVITAPGAGQSAAFLAGSWVIGTPSKGWFNDGGQGGDTAPLLSTIDATLLSNGIETNMGELANPSATPATEGAGALYFEKTGQGKIVFEKTLNMSDQATVAVLQNLGTAMEMSGGHVKFDSTTAAAMAATGAKIYMYGLTLPEGTTPTILVDGVPATGGDVESASYGSGTLSFTAKHFTEFDVLTDVYVRTDGDDTVCKGSADVPLGAFTGVNQPCAVRTIATGITQVSTGGTVRVAAGTYAESVVIGKGFTLRSTTEGGATIAPAAGPGVEIDASPAATPVTVTGFTITPQDSALDSAQGIVIGKATDAVATHNITISSSTITTVGQNMGILVRGVGTNAGYTANSTGLTVTGNTITLSGDSTALYASWVTPAHSNWSITNNTFNSPVGVNLELYNVDGVTVSNNIFRTSGSGGSGNVFIGAELDNALTGPVTFSNNDVQGNGAGGGSMVVFTTNLQTAGTATMGGVAINGNAFNNWDSRALLIHKVGVTVTSINENKFLDSGQAVDNRNGVVVDATNNWWGTAVLADVAAKISGNGNLTYKPYYIDDAKTTLSNIKAITAFSFDALNPVVTGTVNEGAKTIALTVPAGTNAAALTPAITITGASVSPVSGASHDFTSPPTTYTVTAIDETTQAYAVTVTVTPQATPTFSPVAGAVALGSTVTITSSGADHIYYTTDGTDPATSVSGSTSEYGAPLTIDAAKTIKAIATRTGTPDSAVGSAAYTQAASANLTNIALSGTPGNYTFAGGTYTYNGVTIANSVSSITVTPTGAGVTTMSLDGGAPATLTSGVASDAIALTAGAEKTITVIATETGKSAKTYTINVTRALSSTKAITAFSFPSGTGVIDETGHTITVNVPNGTDVTALVATFTTTGVDVSIGGTSQVSATTANDFSVEKTYRVTAENSATQDYVVTVTVLAATQVAPDNTGAATVDSTTPEVVITNPTQAATVTINSGTTNPTLDVSAFITGGTGTLPEINITSANANNTTVAIPASTVVTSASTTWDGVIAAPTITTVTLPDTSGETKTLSTAIEIGFAGEKLTFDKAVRLLLPGQAGKRAGYVRTGITFTEITSVCAADDQGTGNALAADSECKIDVGSDLVIWTKHFTSFATYTQTTNSTGGGTSGGGGGSIVGLIGNVGGTVAVALPYNGGAAPVATVQTGSVGGGTGGAIGQVLGATVYNFVRNLGVGSRGDDVGELQKVLIAGGHLKISAPTGYFGALTSAAVRAYQQANGVEQAGVIGPKTRALLNRGEDPAMTGEARSVLLQQLQSQLQVLLQRINDLQAAAH